MAKNPHRRQRRPPATTARSLAELLSSAAASPIRDCCTVQELWENGMGNVLISRQLSAERVAFAMFLVDRWCLGVKGTFGNVIPVADYVYRLYGPFSSQYQVVKLEPAAALKLLDGAVRYASRLGFPPDREYLEAVAIFGDIDPAQSSVEFEYGHGGKPHFMAGPDDTRETCRQIIRTLEKACGKGGYNFTVPFFPDPGESLPEGAHLSRYDDDGNFVEAEG